MSNLGNNCIELLDKEKLLADPTKTVTEWFKKRGIKLPEDAAVHNNVELVGEIQHEDQPPIPRCKL